MLSAINGILTEISPPTVTININGLYYEVFIPLIDLDKLPTLNQNIFLFTHFVVKEDSHTLFGFVHKESRSLFKSLIKISGIGPKTALAFFSKFTAQELTILIQNQDINAISSIPGIGKKTAERLILELKGKLIVHNETTPSENIAQYNIKQDICNALLSLGYKDKEIDVHINKINYLDVQDGIKQCLQLLSNKK